MATVRHLGLFPVSSKIVTTDGVARIVRQPCIESVDIVYRENIDYREFFESIDRVSLPFEYEDIIYSPFRLDSLQEAMAYYWRVRYWKLDWLQSYSGPAEPPEFDWEEDIGGVDSENKLVCGNNWNNPVVIDADQFYPMAQIDMNSSWFNNTKLFPILKNEDNEYFANIKITGFAEDLIASYRTTKDPSKLLTWRVEADVYEHLSGPFVGTTIFEISPLEFWPYDPGDGGGPIYDKDTGDQLRPFPK